jgi:hypothetical protein
MRTIALALTTLVAIASCASAPLSGEPPAFHVLWRFALQPLAGVETEVALPLGSEIVHVDRADSRPDPQTGLFYIIAFYTYPVDEDGNPLGDERRTFAVSPVSFPLPLGAVHVGSARTVLAEDPSDSRLFHVFELRDRH